MLRVLSFATLTALVAGMPALAHSPYLLPNTFDVVDRKHVTVQASFTEEFFLPDVVMKSDDYHVLSPDGAKHALTPVYMQDLAILEVPTPSPGTYRVSTGQRSGRTSKAVLRDGEWEFIEPGKPAPADAKVYDIKSLTLADVFITRGKPNDAALAPRNSGLEFRPLLHPNGIFVGGNAQFEVLFDGKPLANQPVAVHSGDERYATRKPFAEVKSDAAGRISVKVDRPGPYLAMTRYRRMPAADGQPASSYTYSVTFEVTE